MGYVPINGGKGSSGGLFPPVGKAITIEGFCYEGFTMHDISSSFTIAQGGLSGPVYAVGAGFIANVTNANYSGFTVSGAKGAYAGCWFYDGDGNVIAGSGRSVPNTTHAIPSNTAFIIFMANNYQDNTGSTISVTFA